MQPKVPMVRLSWLLLWAALAMATTNSLEIAPSASSSGSGSTEAGGNPAMTVYDIDVSGMLEISDSPSIFWGVNEIQVQLAVNLPVWTLKKDRFSRMSPDMFYGASEDGTIGCSLFRYQTILTGSVTDRVNQITYEINAGSSAASYQTITLPDEFYPDPKDPPTVEEFDPSLSGNNASNSGLNNNNQDAMQSVCTTEDDCTSETDLTPVTWDVAIVFTASAECQRSNQACTFPCECVRSEATLLKIQADISMAVAEANMAHANSDTGVTINVVALEPDYTYEEEDIFKSLFSLQDPNDGLLDDILATRESTFADLVHLVNFHPNDGGLAFLFSPLFPESDFYAFGVTSSINLFAQTFAHELGHNAVRLCHLFNYNTMQYITIHNNAMYYSVLTMPVLP